MIVDIIQRCEDGFQPYITGIEIQGTCIEVLRAAWRVNWFWALTHWLQIWRCSRKHYLYCNIDQSMFIWYGYARTLIWAENKGFKVTTIRGIPRSVWLSQNPISEMSPQWWNDWRKEQ
jgi:hypothetical protein